MSAMRRPVIRRGGFRHLLTRTAILLAAFAWACTASAPPGDIVTEFKYGSIGTEGTVGVPYWLFVVLPEVFRSFADYRMIVYALALVIVMILRPQGIMGVYELWDTRIWKKVFKR